MPAAPGAKAVAAMNFPADVKEAAAGFPELQAQAGGFRPETQLPTRNQKEI